jgi:hypothetical protein
MCSISNPLKDPDSHYIGREQSNSAQQDQYQLKPEDKKCRYITDWELSYTYTHIYVQIFSYTDCYCHATERFFVCDIRQICQWTFSKNLVKISPVLVDLRSKAPLSVIILQTRGKSFSSQMCNIFL